jgi:exodeoxyribonuclease VII small subunit
MPKKKDESINFEASLKELNTIVEEMEAGGLSLEESLEKFAVGITLTRECQQALKNAEQKVQILLEKSGKDELQTYEESAAD